VITKTNSTYLKNNQLKVGVISLGCSKNRVNTEQMMFLLSNAGYLITGDTENADIILINTCGFIESAKTEATRTILEFSEAKKEGRIKTLVVAGCLPQRYKEKILNDLPEIDALVGTGSFDDIVDIIKQGDRYTASLSGKNEAAYLSPCFSFNDINSLVSETPRIISTSPVWAYIKIAEGCDNCCAYCCIPDIRGKFRSRPMENIIAEAEKLAENGIQELIVVAQDVTMYGLDIYGKRMLSALLTELNKIKKLKWIRLHYLYPEQIDDELIDVIAKSDRIIKYLDIPVQHINDKILQKMNRRGSGKSIRGLFNKLRERIPGVVLRTSLITGLPGEGEDEFKELYDFIKESKIERVGVFPYSPEEGTKAALMENPGNEIAEKRADKLMNLQSHIMEEWNNTRVGTVTDIILEDMTTEIEGKTYYLARSYAESPEIDGYILIEHKKNTEAVYLSPCLITKILNGNLIGEFL